MGLKYEFCMRLKKNTVATILLLQEAYGNESLGASMIKRRHKMFPDGRELVEFELQSGKPKTMRVVININTIMTTIKDEITIISQHELSL